VQCEALNASVNPPDILKVNPGTEPWKFTVSVVSRYDRTVTGFPREYPMWVPFVDKGGMMEIEEARTRELGVSEGFPPRVYVP